VKTRLAGQPEGRVDVGVLVTIEDRPNVLGLIALKGLLAPGRCLRRRFGFETLVLLLARGTSWRMKPCLSPWVRFRYWK
jgi:hypothetical protein